MPSTGYYSKFLSSGGFQDIGGAGAENAKEEDKCDSMEFRDMSKVLVFGAPSSGSEDLGRLSGGSEI